jgi:hypothetical protein
VVVAVLLVVVWPVVGNHWSVVVAVLLAVVGQVVGNHWSVVVAVLLVVVGQVVYLNLIRRLQFTTSEIL